MSRIKSGKNFKEHASTSFSCQLPVCLLDLKGALQLFHTRAVLYTMKNSQGKFRLDPFPKTCGKDTSWKVATDEITFTSMSSAISWDEFPQSPGQYYLKLHQKKFSLNKLLSDRLNQQSFIIKQIDCSQEGDKIIYGLKRKTKRPLRIITNRQMAEAMTA